MPRPLSAEKVEQILEMAEQGFSREEIAAEVGVTTRTVTRYRVDDGRFARRIADQEEIEERKRRVAEFTRQGLGAQVIADLMKINIRTVVRDRGDTGVAQPPPNRLTPEEIATMERFLAEGTSLSEAARSAGRNPGSVHGNKRFQGRAWTPQQTAEHAAACRRLGRCG